MGGITRKLENWEIFLLNFGGECRKFEFMVEKRWDF